MKYILAISGISGSGKSFVEERLLKMNDSKIMGLPIRKLRQVTTRSRRTDSEDAVNSAYVFVSDYYYESLVSHNFLMSKSTTEDGKYGTLADLYDDDTIYTVLLNAKGTIDTAKWLKDNLNRDEYKVIHIIIDSNQSDDRGTRDLAKEISDLNSIDESQFDQTWNIYNFIPDPQEEYYYFQSMKESDKNAWNDIEKKLVETYGGESKE